MRSFALALLLSLAGCSATRGFVYYPTRDAGTDETPTLSPGEGGGPIENVRFPSEDGTRLHAWLARQPGATLGVLFCHGNGGCLEEDAASLVHLRRTLRASVLEVDYRGYGRSAGEPCEEGVCADARAALEALGRATGIPHERTIVVGHSLGGAVAIDLASRTPDLGALVVLASFTSMDDMVEKVVGFPGLGWLVPESYDSLSKVGSIRCPKLFVHGDADPVVPFEQGERLYAAAAEPKRFVRVAGAGHELPEQFFERGVPIPGSLELASLLSASSPGAAR